MIDGKFTEEIYQSKGCRQGGIIETLEFIFYYQEIINKLNKLVGEFGVEYMKNKRINNFVLVDDLTCLHMTEKNIEEAMKEFQVFIDKIKEIIDSVLLEINIDKTGYTIHN